MSTNNLQQNCINNDTQNNVKSFNKIKINQNNNLHNDYEILDEKMNFGIEEITIETAREKKELNKITNQPIINSNKSTDRNLITSDRFSDRYNSDRNKINSLENIDEDKHLLSERLKNSQKEHDNDCNKDNHKIINIDAKDTNNNNNKQINECNPESVQSTEPSQTNKSLEYNVRNAG